MSKRILTIVGARPQIIKAAALSRAIRNHCECVDADKCEKSVREIILHTGQHYDANMSDIFFDELGVPKPDYNLNVGSGSHGVQTAAMISGIEEVLLKEKPDAVVLYGDTNSTLAGAVAASKLHIPVAHIEAGLRSFNKAMPEEINRIMCDHSSTFLFTPTVAGMKNLAREGFDMDAKGPYSIDNPGVFHTGDVMFDNSLFFAEVAHSVAPLNEVFSSDEKYSHITLEPGKFILATIHRNNNTDDSERLSNIFRALVDIAENKGIVVVLPLHPRTSKMLKQSLSVELYDRVTNSPEIVLTSPVSFFEMITLEKGAKMIITDSGGVQKEAFFFRKPSLILRPQTEWVEIVECGSALLVDADYDKIILGYDSLLGRQLHFPSIFGDGHASEAILDIILNY
ncbi:MAG: UDP-N-acetylglucosamine 2-epimerase [Bacteroidetes bacterium GWF2_40_14]|nr:MAG: UDP-N-acetylglucosamine 2-epimerase [Bacteroidetes bacterium GWF2_40_14]